MIHSSQTNASELLLVPLPGLFSAPPTANINFIFANACEYKNEINFTLLFNTCGVIFYCPPATYMKNNYKKQHLLKFVCNNVKNK